MMFYLLF